MLNIIIFLIGIIGAGLLSFGAWLILPAAGYITAGVLCITWSYMAAKMLSANKQDNKEGS